MCFVKQNIFRLCFMSLKLILAFFGFLSFYMDFMFCVSLFIYFIFPFFNYWCELEDCF